MDSGQWIVDNVGHSQMYSVGYQLKNFNQWTMLGF